MWPMSGRARPAAPTRVLLRFDMLGMEMGKLERGPDAGAERYTTRGSFTSMGGRWQIEVVLRRAGFDDVRTPLRWILCAAHRLLSASETCRTGRR